MKQQWLDEEQADLDRLTVQMELMVEQLDKVSFRPVNEVDARREISRKARLNAISDALPLPYIGRLEVVEGDDPVSYRIGKKGIDDDDFMPLIYDWRSPLGEAYYAFIGGGDGHVQVQTPEGIGDFWVRKKRTVHIRERWVLDVRELYSELYPLAEQSEEEAQDPILRMLLEQQGDDHQLREIIASIQKEQNDVIRLGITQPILVQGVAGSGKTSIALHRISFMLYHHQKQLDARNIVVLAPNRIFLNYMREIVKELDIQGIQQMTMSDLAMRLLPYVKEVRHAQYWLEKAMTDPDSESKWDEAIRYKTSMEFHNDVNQHLEQLSSAYLPVNFPKLKSFTDDLLDLSTVFTRIYEGYRHLPLNARREETIKSIHSWKELELTNQRKGMQARVTRFRQEWIVDVHDSLAVKGEAEAKLLELAAVKLDLQKRDWEQAIGEYVDGWRKLQIWDVYADLHRIETLLQLNSDMPETIAHGMEEEAGRVLKERGKLIAYEDIALLLLLEQKVNGLQAVRFDYMLIDEAQDYYPFLLRMLREMTKSMTMLGDVTQSICHWTGIKDWSVLDSVFDIPVHRIDLTVSYRSTIEIMQIANQILQRSQLGVSVIHPVKRHGPVPVFTRILSYEELLEQLALSVQHCLEQGYRRIAVVVHNLELCRAFHQEYTSVATREAQLVEDPEQELQEKVIFIPSVLVKGLEFDAVIIPSTYGTTIMDARLLFVSVTRAQQALHILYYDQPGPFLINDQFQLSTD
ncbi:HelD family protein [Paenibacillus agricola]|uniref:AAA family ATPase n=1 Tax=Paenibacillus agricola TaxID=2716264 RepID=A0ABX0JG76_9BACL|nr:UvrD-helicase domain-containing protein [Paenibacillus agricola]NHN34375.1 AAA family ATPase [Paenibacillus agricola]